MALNAFKHSGVTVDNEGVVVGLVGVVVVVVGAGGFVVVVVFAVVVVVLVVFFVVVKAPVKTVYKLSKIIMLRNLIFFPFVLNLE